MREDCAADRVEHFEFLFRQAHGEALGEDRIWFVGHMLSIELHEGNWLRRCMSLFDKKKQGLASGRDLI